MLLAILPIAASDSKEGGALSFKENKRQWDSRILYETELHDGSIFLCKNNLTFILLDSGDMNVMRRAHHPHMYNPNLDLKVRGHVFRENFLHASSNCRIAGRDKLKEYYNYYIGKDPSRWAGGVGGYHHVIYSGIYNNIDLDVTSVDVSPKYNFIIKPGGNADDILINYEGLDGIGIVNEELVLKTPVGEVFDTKPYAYQVINGQKKEVRCSFNLKGKDVSFLFPEGYNREAELIIDPVLIFSTFSGSTTDNFGYSATYDSKGNAYAAGTAFYLAGYSYPVTPGAFQMSWAGGVGFGQPGLDGTGTDVSITKYDSAGTTRIYSTYLGGDHDELPHSLIVNSNDELFVMGTTASDNFPVTHGAYDTTFNGGVDPGVFNGIGIHYSTGCDIFITRFNSTGTALLGSTYLGGADNDGIVYPEYQGLNYNYADEVRGEINIDKSDNVYIASCTRSTNFPVTAGAYQTTIGGATDGVLVKMNSDLTTIIWSTYLGGSDDDAIHSVDFDQNGDLFVAGGTISNNFPITTGVLQNTNRGGRAEGFITHMSQNGNAILQSTYYGSPDYDQVYFVKTDKHGYAYVYGQTEDTTGRFIFNAAYSKPHSGQFISKLSPHLDSIIWSTVFGSGRGTPDISPTAFLVDVCSKTCISGWGSNFFADYNIVGSPPLSTQGLYVSPGCIQPTTDNQDFYVMVMADDASAITYATYFGSNGDEEHVDGGTSRFDKKGVIYQSVCAGCNGMSTFPTTPGVVSRTNNSPNCNNAVFKIDLLPPIVVADFSAPNTICIPDTITFNNSSRSASTPSYVWTFGDGTGSTQVNPTHIYTLPGIYNIQLVVNDGSSCNFTDTLTKQIVVLAPGKTDTLSTLYLCPGVKGQLGISPSYDTSITYLWIPSVYLSQGNVANPFVNAPVSENYELLVSNGVCKDTFKQSVIVYSNKLTIAGDTLLCLGDTSTIAVSNSTPGQYTYSWQPVSQILSGADSAIVMVKPSRTTTYVVGVTGIGGCVYTDSLRVRTDTLAGGHAAFSNPAPVCVPDTVNFTNQSNFSRNPVFEWNFGDGTTSTDTNPMHIYTIPGVYNVQLIVTFSGNCKVSDTVSHPVVVLTNSSADTLPGFIVCPGSSQQIGFNPGKDSTIKYQWTPATYLNRTDTSSPVATPLQTITYQLVVSAKTCSDTFRQTVVVDNNTLTVKGDSLLCSGDTATLSANNSLADHYSYVWQPVSAILTGADSSVALVEPTQSTMFVLTESNSHGCIYRDSLFIRTGTMAQSNAAFNNPVPECLPDTVRFNNQSQFFQNPVFSWNFGDGNSSTDTNPTHIYFLPGIYNVQLIVSYGGKCKISDTVSHQVIALTNTSADTLPTYKLCLGNTQQIGVNAGQSSLVKYQWIPATYLNNADTSSPVSAPLQSINYRLVISANFCSDTFTQKLLIDTDAITLSGGTLVCAKDTLTLHAQNSQPAYQISYVWQPAALIISGDSSANAMVNPGQTTTFSVTGTDQLGCVLKDSIVVPVLSVLPSVHAYAIPDTLRYGDTTQLNLTLSNNVTAIEWSADSTIVGALTISNPQADPKGNHTYFVRVEDSATCKRFDSVTVYVFHTPCSASELYIPNAFTPNGDGKNDVLYVRSVGLTNVYFAVYDRWGQKMFETTDITRGWDGTFKGKKMDAAVFGYYVKAQCTGGETFEKKGNVTLLR